MGTKEFVMQTKQARPGRFRKIAAGVVMAAAVCLVLFSQSAVQAGKKSDAEVKVTVSARKPDASGMQTLTVTLNVNKGWHIYANPVGNSTLAEAATKVVKVTAKEKVEDVKPAYPAGKLIRDKDVGNYKVYEDKVEIPVTLKRTAGDISPLQVELRFMACSDKGVCLMPATVKITAK
jgi:DsbC/DsbD-like thiol-disulfide interchange protein